MSSDSIGRIKTLTKYTILLTITVIMLGAYTRLSDAGLGCPDWPGCYGQLVVPTQEAQINQAMRLFPNHTIEPNKAWLEMIHRYVAGALGLCVFAIALMCLFTRQVPKKLPLFLLILVIGQAMLGMWTVTMKLMPIVVMGHLLGGFSLLSLLVLLYQRLNFQAQPFSQIRRASLVRFVAALALCVLIIQVMLGGWTSANYAALMCTALPFCEGDWQQYLDFSNAFQWSHQNIESYEFGVLDYPARMTIHVSHRVGALVTACIVMLLAAQLLLQDNVRLKRVAIGLIFLLGIQILLGISNVVFQLPLAIAVLHNIGAALLLANLVYTNYIVWQFRPELCTKGVYT
ncbi:cytochrome B [Vibrio sp. 10N.286.49.B3]|uniref:COX15/CtaA family protein n=1 Tax=Vibrio sp. 10N.286.49.B3 TaxID=1880855 RepID=UPI000C83C684|nr:COX15/CtaA family protein [Vibrio sp. 10N.286.49.B3]PMH44538.1 cytochrome B [Vibrio sp. 10N.286.49.B3]